MADAFRIEIEDFIYSWGFAISQGNSFASGGDFAYLAPNQKGAGATYFSGPSGQYDVVVHYFDEGTGSSGVLVDINGEQDIFYMDDTPPGASPRPASHTTHRGIDIDKGDIITLHAQSFGQEHAAIDYIEFVPIEEDPTPAPPPVPAPPAPTPSAPPSANDTPSTLDAFEQEVLALTNAARAEAGLAPLRHNPALAAAADKHSEDMALKDYFSHTEPDGDSLGDRIRAEGYTFRSAGENIAAGYDTPEEVVNAWLNSSGHRANLLSPNYEEIGIGYYLDTPEDRYDEYWTQVFATEADVA